jgi:phenylalanyl-tRNA synthetase beta chain
MDFEVLLTSKLEPVKYSPLPRFPAIERDLSIIVDETITWQTIDNAIRQLKISELEHIEFGELFRGKQIPKGQKSLFFTLRYRSNDRSLTHEEVDGCQQKVMALLEANCQAKLRMV